MRAFLTLAGTAALVGLLVVLGCGGKPQQCAADEWKCGKDGKLYCNYLPSWASPAVDLACCPPPPAGPDASTAADGGFDGGEGEDAATAGEDAAAPGEDAAVEGEDAGEVDAATGGGGGAAKDAGLPLDWCPFPNDAGMGWFWALVDAGILPTGRDDAGLPFLYRCGFDVCHPINFPFDGGIPSFPGPDASRGQCGPLGCD